MASFLNKLPIEIRNQIYEDLLLYNAGPIKLNFDGNAIDRWHGRNVGLHTAVLRTCKQAYAEGSNVLYGHNHFHYCPTIFLSHRYKKELPITCAFQKIKHVSYFSLPLWFQNAGINHCFQIEIAREPKNMWFGPGDICAFVENLATIVQFLNLLGCSPKTLKIRLVFHNGQFENGHWRIRCDPRFKIWGCGEAIKKAFCDIQVENSITISLDCFDEELGTMFEDVANGSRIKEKWNVKSAFRKTTLELDKRRDELWDNFSPPGCDLPGMSYSWDSIRYSWTWTLTPTEMVKAKRRPKIPIEEESDSSEEE